jgi:hypothetical protein
MNPILFLSLVIILSAALPWWPYSAYGRSRHRRPWDWLLDTPSREEKLSWQHAYETKIVDQRNAARGRRASPEASQEASQRAAIINSELLRQFEEQWGGSKEKPLGLTV